MTDDVTIGARYRHDETGKVLKMESASSPELSDYVILVEPESFAKNNCFIGESWRGSWQEFFNQWTKL